MIELGEHITSSELLKIVESGDSVRLHPEAKKRVAECYEYIQNKIANSDDLIYGINTGFGSLCNTVISKNNLQLLQENLIQSHACGMGDLVPVEIVKVMILLKVLSLGKGHSGVQLTTVERLLDMYNEDVLPVLYEQGSLGASGDLAPLAHLALPLIGLGEVQTADGIKPASDFDFHKDYRLKAKEGLALINGTQFMLAYACTCVVEGMNVWRAAQNISALSTLAYDARLEPFYPESHRIRNQAGQIESASQLFKWLNACSSMHDHKKHVQDPYSFRCIPQVHGASLDAILHAEEIFEREINAVTDNPNIFPDEDKVLSAGNFHGQALALQLDFLAIALSEIASISERRLYKLIRGERDLPAFLMHETGLNSGFMIAQYTAASIVSQNKQLCTPASVDSMVSSNGQEDHVSMGANSATKCLRVLHNTQRVLGIEYMLACQAIDIRGTDWIDGHLTAVHGVLRKKIPFLEKDAYLSPYLHQATELIKDKSLWVEK
jgi:histidine ammonia-lyase